MKTYKTKKVSTEELESITCDYCHTTHEDIGEMQEFVSIDQFCGYNNMVFGDTARIRLDLCQYCAEDLLGKYIRVEFPE